MDVDEAIAQGFLAKEPADNKLVEKELKEAGYDLDKARTSFSGKDFKWSIVKSYYAMFHAAKAVLFRRGLREKRHFIIPIALSALVDEGKLEASFVADFNAAIFSREQADYYYGYSEEVAWQMIRIAERFVQRMKKLS